MAGVTVYVSPPALRTRFVNRNLKGQNLSAKCEGGLKLKCERGDYPPLVAPVHPWTEQHPEKRDGCRPLRNMQGSLLRELYW